MTDDGRETVATALLIKRSLGLGAPQPGGCGQKRFEQLQIKIRAVGHLDHEAAGLLDQQTQQNRLDVGYGDWLNQQQHPYDQLTFQRNLISGFPGSTTNTTAQTSPTSNWASDAAGIGTAIGGIGSLFNLWAQGGSVPPRASGLGHGRVAQLYGSLK